MTFKINDAVFVTPPVSNERSKINKGYEEKLEKAKMEVDEDKYPEFYRKTTNIKVNKFLMTVTNITIHNTNFVHVY